MLDATMADAEELMRSAPHGSIPWAQAVNASLSGMLVAADALAAAEDARARCAAMDGCGLFRGVAVRLVHAEALHATSVHDAARHAIAGARSRLFAIAGKIPDPAYQASFLEQVPENARTLTLARAWLGDAAPSA